MKISKHLIITETYDDTGSVNGFTIKNIDEEWWLSKEVAVKLAKAILKEEGRE